MHVQCTCKCFAPIDLFPPPQAKRWASLMRNLLGTCILSRRLCFCDYRSCGVQAARARIGNSQVTRVLYQLKIRWGCRSSGVPAARARGEEAVLTLGPPVKVNFKLATPNSGYTFLTWGPPVKVNFELATPNSVHGCTLARPTWRRMKKRAGLHCARAVHVQMFCTLVLLPPLKARRHAPLMPNLQVTCMPPQPICICGYRSCPMQVARASKGKVYLTGVLRF